MTITSPNEAYGTRPCYGELIAILLVGLTHVVLELAYSGSVATLYNVGVSLTCLAYVVWRIRQVPGVLRNWGFRADNLGQAFVAQFRFVLIGVLVLIIFAYVSNSPGLPVTFWLTLALYPVWGIAQQFALQNFIANNLSEVTSKPYVLALVAASLFSVSHFPRMELVALTFLAGVFFTVIYRKHPNLWAVGTAHGLLGSMAFYIVLGEDPGQVIISFLTGR